MRYAVVTNAETGAAVPRPNRGRVQVCAKFDPEDIDWLEAAAAERGIPVVECLRRLVTAQRLSGQATFPPRGGHSGSAPIAQMPKVTTAPATGGARPHRFTPQSGNALRCECGQRKAAH